MSESEKEGETTKKIVESPQREPKKNEEKKELKKVVETIKELKVAVPNPESIKKEPIKKDNHLNEKILLFAGIPATVLLAIIIQYFYHHNYVIPLQERTLINVVKFEISQSPWITRTNGSAFSLIYETGLKVQFKYVNEEENKLEFFWIKGNEKFSKIALNDSLLEAKILFTGSDWEMSLSAEASAYSPKRFKLISNDMFNFSNGSMVLKKHRFVTDLDVSAHGIDEIVVEPGKEVHLKLLSKEVANAAFSERLSAVEADYDGQFNSVFQLKSKSIPEFYQNMGKSALSSVLSALYTEERVFTATGDYNSWFQTSKLPFTHLHLPEGCEDLRTQGLATLSIIDLQPTAVLQLITSWTNFVNMFGRIPANVSSVADYKTKIAPALFIMLDDYVSKNGILALKPIYQNIEKIGLGILSLNTDVRLFSSTDDSYFFEKPQESNFEVYTVELHSLIVKASRVLLRLSSEFGDRETAQKFLNFNAVVDQPEVLKEYQTGDGTHANFILKKIDGKEIKEFIPCSESLAPLIFQLLSPESKELEVVLARLSDPEIYWTNYGIRSADGVSVAQNFMLLKALSFYSQQSGPRQGTAHSLYARLRNNLIMFVAQEFKKTKSFWEYYSSKDGHGLGRMNWLPSATILKIMAELY